MNDFDPVGRLIDGAEAESGPESPAPRGRGGRKFGAGDVPSLPDECPVEPLGVEGGTYFYLDSLRQLRPIAARDHSRLNLMALWGDQTQQLYEAWPRSTKEGVVTGWKPEECAEALMRAAAERGVWSPQERVRGAGAWVGADGELLLHCGDAIWQGPPPAGEFAGWGTKLGGGVWHQPGLIEGLVYPAGPAGPRPDFGGAGRPSDPEEEGVADPSAAEILALLQSWHWRRKDLDARLALGWIAAAMLSGALKWRPLVWVTGGAGTGKSTLHELVRGLLGGALLAASDATPAGIWQKLGYNALPVELDELESEEDSRRSDALLKLARQACSGGVVLRGGAEHTGREFIARSCFLFSSILVPPMMPQDRSRMAILELEPLARGGKPPLLSPAHLRALGARLKARLALAWADLPATLEAYRAALMQVGHGARGADQFGALLACSALLLRGGAALDGDQVAADAAALSPAALAASDGDDLADEELMLQHLMSTIVDPWRGGERRSLGHWVAQAIDAPRANLAGEVDPAVRSIQAYGLRLEWLDGRQWLAIANGHRGLAEIFRDTRWKSGAGTKGVWAQAARRLPGARPSAKPLYFDGAVSRAVLIPVDVLRMGAE